MRTFIALEISQSTRSALASVAAQLKPRLGRISWVKPDRMHLTIKFLGEIEEKLAGLIGENLEQVCAAAKPFALEVVGLGCFPNPRRPRVVWAGLEGDIDRARELQRAVDACLKPLGFSPEKRPFSPHVTLGRVKGDVRAAELQQAIEQHAGTLFGTEGFSEVVLMRSQLRPQGPIYTPLGRYPLTG